MGLKKIQLDSLIITGTRPEIIKMAPVYLEMKKAGANIFWCHTGQHESLAEQTFGVFDIKPDFVLQRTEDDGVTMLVSGLLANLERLFKVHNFSCVLVHGDTASTLAGALTAFYNKIPVIAHVEAGLRSGDLSSPFPEESNRLIVAQTANLHFPPTKGAYDALIKENVPHDQVCITGNTVIDAQKVLLQSGMVERKQSNKVLVTAHRRENWEQLDTICDAIIELTNLQPDLEFIFSVHPNPKIKSIVKDRLTNVPQVTISDPLDYLQLQRLLAEVKLVLTDSGGIQEEAPTYGKRVVVLRETTERPEAVQLGFSILTGASDIKRIIDGSMTMLSLGDFATDKNPFGDGEASKRIVMAIAASLESKYV
ncbi:non-hydrolyzing UDP-N-acetylglucosamine 2-epimerase [Vibrio vulnificus]|uniref:non-hydrolyzing UDP-N-acetylglucosamine 2-epimerase n=1 Tax=Vibrio vulnificus TaxID=672 RepID=UPI003EDA7200